MQVSFIKPSEVAATLRRVAGWGVVAWTLSGCASDLAVHRQDTAAIPASAAVQTLSSRAIGNQAGDPERRRAAAALIDQYGAALLAAPGHTVRVPDAAGGAVRLSLRRGAGAGGVDPDRFVVLKPTDDYRVRSKSGLAQTAGAGVPLVATLQPVAPVSTAGPVQPEAVPGIACAMTALPVASSAGAGGERAITFDLYDPHDVPPTSRLAADYSTPLAVTLAHFGPQQRGLRGFMGIAKEDFSAAGMYSTELPTPDKTPLVLVHGLISDPTYFHDLQNHLASDPEVRRHYQVWIFYYPTSLPVP